ncbi:DnaA ATPase domain-containing protein [Ureaplasma diversum]|uniref:DnaA ATPase domain-containing protein n=1 Tax=Ureaplasma diversum TaxID=42094 RepID=UPI001AD8115E|nr:DnaA/Hda family protein [Ureaplasma diversum]
MEDKKAQVLYKQVINSLDPSLVSENILNILNNAKAFNVSDGILKVLLNDKISKIALNKALVETKLVTKKLIDLFSKNNYEILNVVFITENESQIEQVGFKVINQFSDNRINFSDENKRMTFDNFIISNFNEKAQSIIQALLKNDDQYNDYNPVFLFGSVGIGKTHLVLAAGNAYALSNPSKKVYYTEANDFYSRYISASGLGSSQVEKIKNEMKEADLLIIDDIQNLASRDSALDVIFTIFNSVKGKKEAKIIITSDKPSKDLKGFPERLISRFGGGIQCKITIPTVLDVKEIIKHWFAQNNIFNYDSEVITYIAENYLNDIRQLIGLLKQIKFWSHELGIEGIIDKDFIDIHLSESGATFGIKAKKQFSLEDVIDLVCREYNLKKEVIKSDSRVAQIILVRKIIYYLAVSELKMSFSDIGRYFGKVHTTISHSYHEINTKLETDEQLSGQIKILLDKMK